MLETLNDTFKISQAMLDLTALETLSHKIQDIVVCKL